MGLVLTRKHGEAVRIIAPNGDELTVTVGGRRDNQIRLIFDGPQDYTFWRTELLDKEPKR